MLMSRAGLGFQRDSSLRRGQASYGLSRRWDVWLPAWDADLVVLADPEQERAPCRGLLHLPPWPDDSRGNL